MANDDLAGPPPSGWRKARLVIKVIELRLRFVALMAATGLVFGYWETIVNRYETWARPPRAAAVASSDSEFFCPMHPSVVQAEPAGCPICGMPLSKRKVGARPSLPAGVLARVALAPDRVAQAGIRTVAVAYAPLAETIATVGSVAFDERRVARIASKTRGMARVEALHVNFTGVRVEAGEPLADLYSPELYQATRELLLARPRGERARGLLGDEAEVGSLAREKLGLWGVTPGQVEAILAKGKAETRLAILSPIGGTVIRKNVVAGDYVAEGQAMFEVADLSRVWVLAQVYESQLAMIRVGQPVEATVAAYPGESFRGEVAFVAPTVDPATRTVAVRYDLPNPGERLRPGMFATVTLHASVADSPAFRARVAARGGASGRARTVAEQSVCPVTSLKLGAMGEPVAVEVGGEHLWICCGACSNKLKAEPARFLARLAPAPRDEVLSVPESAVIDTGTRRIVYVEAEPGIFEGREVTLGPASGDRYPVLDGLSPGERVAAAGSFLIDAENRLNPPPSSAPAPTPPGPPAREVVPRSAGREGDVIRR